MRAVAAAAALSLACAETPDHYRGGRLQPATLPAADVVRIYRTALAASFDLADPTLSILVDPMRLPRSQGLAGGDSLPADVRSLLERNRVVRGACSLQVERSPTPLVCRAERPGYVARFSTPFAMSEGGDSVQVYMVVQQYATPTSPKAERLRFERAYQMVRSGGAWRAVGEARLRQP